MPVFVVQAERGFMYENFKSDFALNLDQSEFDADQIKIIMDMLDKSMYNYDVTEKKTGMVVYNDEMPELVKKYLVTKKMEGYSDATLYIYGRFLYRFFFEIKKTPEQIETDDIIWYLYWYQHRDPAVHVSNRSLDKVLNCIRSFYKWVYGRKFIDFDPADPIKPIKYEIKERQALTEHELEVVRRSCQTLKEKAIVEFLYSTGCRCHELVILKKSDVDWKERTVHIFGKNRKHRTAFLTVRAIFLLKDYLESRKDNNEWLFVSDRSPHEQMHNAGIQKIIRNIAKRANLSKPLSPHIFRHTLATHLINRSCSLSTIQKVLGHEEIGTTMRYAKQSIRKVRDEYEKYIA